MIDGYVMASRTISVKWYVVFGSQSAGGISLGTADQESMIIACRTRRRTRIARMISLCCLNFGDLVEVLLYTHVSAS